MFIAIMTTCTIALSQSSGTVETLTEQQRLARDIFRELIEINTTVNKGSTNAAEAMAARLRMAGYPETDLYIVGPNLKNMNLVARLRGTSKQKPLLFIAHLDVVEAHREDWSFDPFTFIEQGGYFYGRGTSDMKDEVSDIVANFIRLKQEGFIPHCDIVLALTNDEEGGDANGVKWLLDNQRQLIDAEFCINLDCGGGDINRGKYTLMNVQTSEKEFYNGLEFMYRFIKTLSSGL